MPNRTWICGSCGNKNPPLTEACRDCGVGEDSDPKTDSAHSKAGAQVSIANEVVATAVLESRSHSSSKQDVDSQITTTATWRCHSCFRVNSVDASTCSKCGLLQYPDPMPGYRTSARIVLCFQAIFVAMAFIAIIGAQLGFAASIGLLFAVWWGSLMAFASRQAGGNFEWERKAASDLIDAQDSLVMKRIVRVAFDVLYWPIHISKDIYFWAIIVIGSIYYLLKFFYSP